MCLRATPTNTVNNLNPQLGSLLVGRNIVRYKFSLELRDVLNAGCCVCECNNNFIVQEVELVDVDVGWWFVSA